MLVWLSPCALLQPNKVYIGGLPDNTRQEDLQSCFGKIGRIVNIELKYVITFLYISRLSLTILFRVGYGFVVRNDFVFYILRLPNFIF